MKTQFYNCRGMKKPSAVRSLQVLVERIRPDILFLSETHLNKKKATSLMRRLKFDDFEVVESDGRAGGLLMLWHSDLNVTSRHTHSNYIDIRIDEDLATGWRCTGLYGEPSADRKYLTWEIGRAHV